MEEMEKRNYLSMWNGELGADRNKSGYQRSDDGSHIYHNEEEYYEWWYLDASFDNDYHMVVTFHYRNAFTKPMIPSVQISIYKADGTKVERIDLVAPEDSKASPDFCNVVMGDYWLKDQGDHYEMMMKIKGVGAHLKFKNLVPAWKPGTGYTFKNEENGRVAGWVVPVPHASVEGELYLKEGTIAVKGAGYHDHNWGNYNSGHIFSGWYWGRVHNDTYALDYGWVLPRDDEAPVVAPLLIARKNEIVLSTNMLHVDLLDMVHDKEFNKEYARQLVLKAEAEGVKMEMTIRTHRIIESVQLPKVMDWDQCYYRFLAEYELNLEIDGVADQVKGEMLHELMFL